VVDFRVAVAGVVVRRRLVRDPGRIGFAQDNCELPTDRNEHESRGYESP